MPQAGLQQLIDHLSVHACLAPGEDLDSMATGIFKAFSNERGSTPPPDAAREIHIHCVQQLVRLMRCQKNPEEKEQACQWLINEWYDSLIKTEKL